MARQIYAFAIAGQMGWDGPAKALVRHGIEFLAQSRAPKNGGWVKSFQSDGWLVAGRAQRTFTTMHACC